MSEEGWTKKFCSGSWGRWSKKRWLTAQSSVSRHGEEWIVYLGSWSIGLVD